MKYSLTKITIIFKRNLDILLLVALIFFVGTSIQIYNLYKYQKKENFSRVLNNIYFKKTLTYMFDNVNPRYLTIEHKEDLHEEMALQLSGWIYGCDICQEVCPWNIKFFQMSKEESFMPRSNIKYRNIQNWQTLSENDFRKLFKGSAVKRTKYKGLMRNIDAVKQTMDSSLDAC